MTRTNEDAASATGLESCQRTQSACRNPEHRSSWVVIQRKANRSAFSGYRLTPSDYSAVRCTVGGAVWRTKAKYVDTLRDDA